MIPSAETLSAMYVRAGSRAANSTDSHVQARTSQKNRRQKHLRPGSLRPRNNPASTTRPDSPHARDAQVLDQDSKPVHLPSTPDAPSMYFCRPAPPGSAANHPGPGPPDASTSRFRSARERHTTQRAVQRASSPGIWGFCARCTFFLLSCRGTEPISPLARWSRCRCTSLPLAAAAACHAADMTRASGQPGSSAHALFPGRSSGPDRLDLALPSTPRPGFLAGPASRGYRRRGRRRH